MSVRDRGFWQAVAEADYAVPAGHSVAELTPELLAALGSTDPLLRDEYAFPILGTWIERGHYMADELRAMLAQLADGIAGGLGEQGDDRVFRRSFSVLVANEVLGYDNQHRIFREEEVRDWLDRLAGFMRDERDLRGYVAEKGWVHAIAHVADSFRVLARSRYLAAADLERMLNAIADRVLAPGDHVYLYDEDERLALAAMTILRRDLVDLPFLAGWLERLSWPLGDEPWVNAAADPAKLAVYQNAEQFARSFYLQLAFGDRAPGFFPDDPYFIKTPAIREALVPHAAEAVRRLGRGFYPPAGSEPGGGSNDD